MTNEVFARTWGERAGRAGGGVLAGADRARQARAPGLPVHRRGLLGHGVDAAAAGLRLLLRQAALRPARARGRRRRSAATCRPTAPTRSGCCASSRTTTSRAPPRRSRAAPARAAAVVDRRRCRARGCSTTASSTGTASTSRSSSPAGRTSRRTTTCARSTSGCCARSPTPACATATGACARRTGWPDNDSHRQLVAWCWERHARGRQPRRRARPGPRAPAVGRPRRPRLGADRPPQRRERFERDGDELAGEGLYVDARRPWASHFLTFAPAPRLAVR